MGNGNAHRADKGADSANVASERIEGAGDGTRDEGIDPGAGTAGSTAGAAGAGTGARPGKSGGAGGGSARGSDGGNSGSGAKSGTKNSAAVKPAELVGDTAAYQTDENGNIIYKADGTPAKKRGRKPGQKNGETVEAVKAKPKNKADNKLATSVDMLAAQFQLLNTGIAFLTKFDDFALEDSEAKSMAIATANVMDQFDYVPDPKIAACMALVTTTSMIYGPRIYLYNSHRKKLREKRIATKVKIADEKAVSQSTGTFFNSGDFNFQ